MQYLPCIGLLLVALLLWYLLARRRNSVVSATAIDDIQPIILPQIPAASLGEWVENLDEETRTTTQQTSNGEEMAMENSLSRDELSTLLGVEHLATKPEDSADTLTQAGYRAAESLQTFLGTSDTWVAGDPVVAGWDGLIAAQVLPSHSALLVVETKIPGGSIYVVSANLTACMLDDAAMQTGCIESSEEAFFGWRKAVEHLVTAFYLCLAPVADNQELRLRTLAPRRWDPRTGGAGLGEQPKASGLAIPFYRKDEATVTLLMPLATLETLSVNAAKPALKEGAATVSIGLVADIPLQLSATVSLGSQSVKQVAAWDIGALVPLCIQAGQEVDLAVNGRALARGRIMADAGGNLSVQIMSILSLAPDAG